MPKFARIADKIVVEVVDLPTDIMPTDAFHAGVADTFVPAPDTGVVPGMTWNGKKFGPPPPAPPAPAPRSVSRIQFAQEAAIRGLSTEEQALAWAASGAALPDKVKTLVAGLPQAEQFAAKMALCKDNFDRLDPITIKLTTAFGWGDTERADFWSAASAH